MSQPAAAAQLRDLLKRIALNGERLYCDLVVVTEVDEIKAVCAGNRLQGGQVTGIRLNTMPEGILPIPKLGTIITVAYLDPNETLCIHYGELARLIIKSPDIAINEGQNGGLVKVDALTQELNTIQQYLMQVQLQHNALIAALAAMPPLVSFAPALSPTAIPNPPQITLRPTLENFNVKH